MRNPDVFEAIDPAALAHVQGGFAQLIGMLAPTLIGALTQGRQQRAPQQMTAQAQPPGQPPGGQPAPQTAAPTGDAGGDGRVQVTVATGDAAVRAAESLKASMGVPRVG